jgi:hypothetical protein
MFALPPGSYEVIATFAGTHNTKGFGSTWHLTPGWSYQQCLFTSAEAQLF